MISNGRRHELGFAPAVLTVGRILLPFLGYTIGIAVAGATIKSALPEVPINKDKVGLASALAGGGLTAYYLSGSLPEDWKTAAYAAAVAGVSAGAYLLFHGAETKKEPPKGFWDEFLDTLTPGFVKSAAPPYSGSYIPATEKDVSQLAGKITSPVENEVMRQAYGAENFTIRAEIYNPTNQNLTVMLDYDWEETPTLGFWDRSPNYGSGNQGATIPAKQNSVIDIRVPVRTSSILGLGWGSLDVIFKLYLRGSGATARRMFDIRQFKLTAI